MAIKGIVVFRDFEINAYIKVTIGGISEVMVPSEEESQPAKKKFILNYYYHYKATPTSEVVNTGSDSCDCDINSNLYRQAYADLATKLEIIQTEI